MGEIINSAQERSGKPLVQESATFFGEEPDGNILGFTEYIIYVTTATVPPFFPISLSNPLKMKNKQKQAQSYLGVRQKQCVNHSSLTPALELTRGAEYGMNGQMRMVQMLEVTIPCPWLNHPLGCRLHEGRKFPSCSSLYINIFLVQCLTHIHNKNLSNEKPNIIVKLI